MSLIHSANGNFTEASLFIIYASLFDAVDGLAARLTELISRFGVD
ncbi:MAG: CDP-alcohol phosphatidyltransferase family protein [Ignavibacteria bacterium]